MNQFKRDLLNSEATARIVDSLQPRLIDLIDLSLQLKQAHWTVVGLTFQSVHEQLDAILADVRDASDEVAERIATFGIAPDGRASTVADASLLANYPHEFAGAVNTLTTIADRLHATVQGLRQSIEVLGEVDPVSEDMLIGIAGPLEKHLWMLQAQEQ